MNKRGRDSSIKATPAQYALLLAASQNGRISGNVLHPPTCKIIRAITSSGGTSKNDFEHIYGNVCGCEAMTDARNLVASSHAPESVAIKNPCIHLQTLKRLPKFDSTPVPEYGPVAVVDPSLSVADGGDSRVIVAINKKLNVYECLAKKCRFNKRTCGHVDTVHRTVRDHNLYRTDPFLPQQEEESPPTEPPPRRVKDVPRSISEHKVTLNALAERVKKRGASLDAATQWIANGRNCRPDGTGVCEQCQTPWAQSELKVNQEKATVYGCYESLEVMVFDRVCQCGHKKQYDGLSDGVFNYSNKTLWLHETMLTYVDLMVEARMPFNAYFKFLRRQYERRGASTLCSKSTVISSLEAFIRLLDVDYDECYTCPTCTQLPLEEQVYIIDGKAMGFRRDLMEDPNEREYGEKAAIIPGTRFAYIKGDFKAQQLCGSLRRYAKGDGIEDSTFNALIRDSLSRAPELVDVLKYIKKTERTYLKCPTRYRKFIYDIATPCPLSCLIPNSLYAARGGIPPFIDRIVDVPEISQEQRTMLQEWYSLSEMIAGWKRIPEMFAPLLKRLSQIARQVEEDFNADASTAVRTTPDLTEDDMSFFPNHPRIRKPRAFHDTSGGEPTTECTKHVLKSHTFTPGLFSVFCPHGVCIGFEAMRKFESARVPFELFYTRFQSCPGYIIYDNACNASRYCLRREPFFFARVKFLIDRLHQRNHSGCHSGYEIDCCPQSTPILGGSMTLGDLNSQAAEQAHAKMTLIESQTSFMGQATFMAYTKLFMALKNKEILKNLK
jgi:hypothetical protein